MKKLFFSLVFLFVFSSINANNLTFSTLELRTGISIETTSVDNHMSMNSFAFSNTEFFAEDYVNCELIGNVVETLLTTFNGDIGLTDEQIEAIGNAATAICELIESF